MLVVLLPVCLSLLFLFLYDSSQCNKSNAPIREAWLKSLLIFTGLLYLSTEILSFFNAIHTTSIAIFWTTVSLLLLTQTSTKKFKNFYLNLITKLGSITSSYRNIMFVTALFGLLPLLFLCIYSPPNNIDSMNYHLSRVVSWIQNQNVAHFATWHIHQLYLNILAEYIFLHILTLNNGNDYFVALPQFLAMLSSLVAVTLIGKSFGLNYKLQIFVGILLFSMPIGILESTTTQVDYIACFFFLVFVYFSLRFIKTKSYDDFFFLGMALVFGCFTKYSIFFFALPFCIWVAINSLFSMTILKNFKVFGFIVLIYLAVFLPFYFRNFELFDNMVAPTQNHILFQENLVTNKKSVKLTLSNVVKNVGLHLGLPYNQSNLWVDRQINNFHNILGIDINEETISHDLYRTQFVLQEDMAGNLILLILITIALFYHFFNSKNNDIRWLSLSLIIGFIVFCLIMQFQHFSSRTQMPFFALGTVLVGLMFAKTAGKWRWVVMVFALLSSVPYIYGNYNKPLLSVRYLSKYFLGYAPSYLCVDNEKNVPTYQSKLSNYYDFGRRVPCFPPRQPFRYWDRVSIVQRLDGLGHYESDKVSVFDRTRARQYFMKNWGGQIPYNDFMDISKYILPNAKGIGIKSPYGFYNYWAVLKLKNGSVPPIQYIGCHKEFQKLPNEQRRFEYDYILTEDVKWAKNTIPIADIDSIIERPTISLIILKNASTNKYAF